MRVVHDISRTGIDLIDHVLDRFEDSDPCIETPGMDPVHIMDMCEYPDLAAGRCLMTSFELTQYLREAGFAACPSSQWAGYNHLRRQDGFCRSVERQQRLQELGYADAPQPNLFHFRSHVVCVVQDPDSEWSYLIDYTASQYGYDALPLIQRINADGDIDRQTSIGWRVILRRS